MAVVTTGAALWGAAGDGQQPTFREAVDLIEFDVTVVTSSGVPVVGLGTDKFEVTVDGKARRVVSADLVRYDQNQTSAPPPVTAPPSVGIWPDPVRLRQSVSAFRVFVLVIDSSTFDPGSVQGVTRAARAFVEALHPSDMVGLYVFPTGVQIAPTTEHKTIVSALAKVTGQAYRRTVEFDLRPSELVGLSPILHEDLPTVPVSFALTPDQCRQEWGQLLQAFCAPSVGCSSPPPLVETQCSTKLNTEISVQLVEIERDSTLSLGMLRSLVANLIDVPGHKNLVLVSGGIITSDRPSGRPNIGNLDAFIGQEAVKTNTAIYTLFVDWRYRQLASAEQRRGRRTLTSAATDSNLLSRSLDQFTGASGGALFKDLMGNSDPFFDRIAKETSAYYVLGVLPDPKDRDGKPHQLNVKVKQSGVTVRGSRWVTVEKKPEPGAPVR